MSRINRNQFVGLSKSEKNLLSCYVCHQIFDNPLTTDCGHTLCRHCIEECIKTKGKKKCPQCKQKLKLNKGKGSEDNNNSVVISGYQFTLDIELQSKVNELKIKCKFQSNGCQEVIAFGLLPQHLEECKYSPNYFVDITESEANNFCRQCIENSIKSKQKGCPKCKVLFTKETYNHLEVTSRYGSTRLFDLEAMVNKLDIKCKSIGCEKTIDLGLQSSSLIKCEDCNSTELQCKLEERETFISRLVHHLKSISFDIIYALFGTHLTDTKGIRLYDNSISFYDFGIHFKSLKEVMYCCNPCLPVLIIEVNKSGCFDVNRRLPISDSSKGCFDVNSNELSEKYIIIELTELEKMDLFIELLSLKLIKCALRPNFQSIDERRAKSLVTSAQELQTLYFDVKYILFGTHLSNAKAIRLHENSICFYKCGDNFDLIFKNFKTVMYCSHRSLPVLIIEIDSSSCSDILNRNLIPNSLNGWFDVDSIDSSERYIIIELYSDENTLKFIKSLTLLLSKCNIKMICRSISKTEAQQMVTRHQKMQISGSDVIEVKEESIKNEDMSELQSKLKERQDFIYRFSDHLTFVTFDVNYILFGTFLSPTKAFNLYENCIKFRNFEIEFKMNIKKIINCEHPILPVLIIEIDNRLCRNICKRYPIPVSSNGCFDVNSNDSSEKYIIIGFISDEKLDLFNELLALRLTKCRIKLNSESISETKAKQMVISARKMQTND